MKHVLCFRFYSTYFKFSIAAATAAVACASFTASAQTLSWASAGLFDGESVDGVTINASTGPVTMTVAVNSDISGPGAIDLDSNSAAGEGPASFEDDGTFGGISNFVEFGFDNSSCDTNDQFEVVMTFSAPVDDLQMTIVDVDQSSWDDIIEIDIDVDGDGLGPRNIKDFITNSPTIGAPLLTLSASVTEDNESFADGYEGTVSVPAASTAGNMSIDTSSTALSINSLTIRYYSGDDGVTCEGGGNPGAQRVGLSNLEFSGTTVPVTLSYFSSSRSDEAINLEWQTAQEVGHAGFQVYARTATGWQVLTPDLIAANEASASLESKQYSLALPAETGGSAIEWLSLVDVSVNEEVVPHGPFKVGDEYGGKILEAATFDWPEIKKLGRLTSTQADKVRERIKRALLDDEQQHIEGR